MITSETQSQAVSSLQSTHRGHWVFRHTAMTDVGRRRQDNEDYFLLYPERDLYVIADGMGGHAAGDVASRIACETLATYFDETGLPRRSVGEDETSLQHHLIQAIKLANAAIFDEASGRSDRKGMGTTLVALTFLDDHAYWAHVGDSRIYRYRNEDLETLTRDHSLLERTIERQQMSDDEAREFSQDFPYKNVLTRAVGANYVVDVEVGCAELEDGDLFVMTTDGVHDVIGTQKIYDLLYLQQPHWPEACRSIISEANRVGGPDNITVACVEVLAGHS